MTPVCKVYEVLWESGLHLPSTVWPLESLFMYGAISAGVRGVKRDTLTRGREPAAASSRTERNS